MNENENGKKRTKFLANGMFQSKNSRHHLFGGNNKREVGHASNRVISNRSISFDFSS